jgi:hypothetical protein
MHCRHSVVVPNACCACFDCDCNWARVKPAGLYESYGCMHAFQLSGVCLRECACCAALRPQLTRYQLLLCCEASALLKPARHAGHAACCAFEALGRALRTSVSLSRPAFQQLGWWVSSCAMRCQNYHLIFAFWQEAGRGLRHIQTCRRPLMQGVQGTRAALLLPRLHRSQKSAAGGQPRLTAGLSLQPRRRSPPACRGIIPLPRCVRTARSRNHA